MSSSPDHLLNEIRLILPAETASVPIARQAVGEAAARGGFTVEQCGEIEMAADEAITNIIEHGYATPPLCSEIQLLIQEFSDRLEITLVDCSTISFDTNSAPAV